MKKQLIITMALMLSSSILFAGKSEGKKFKNFSHKSEYKSSSNILPTQHYETELSKINSEIKAKEEQLDRIAQELHKLKEMEVKTSAMAEIAKKNAIKKSLESHPIEPIIAEEETVRKSNLEYAFNK